MIGSWLRKAVWMRMKQVGCVAVMRGQHASYERRDADHMLAGFEPVARIQSRTVYASREEQRRAKVRVKWR
ncbi:hypothetical protein ACLOJK_014161 [Asimina triloba]